MLSFVAGTIEAKDTNLLVINCNGVGFELIVSETTNFEVGEIGDTAKVHTYMAVREDGVSLYGFDSPEEKGMFLKLISVSGVGAKMGISILGGMSLNDLALAIATSDVKSLSKIKGLGKKSAERIIVELRESVSAISDGKESEKIVATSATIGSEGENAVMALISLGYNRSTAIKAVNGAIEKGANAVEEIIAVALRSLA